MMRITIAGASGFIGSNLLKKLKGFETIRGLSRSHKNDEQDIEWAQANLFSYQSTLKALEGTDIAVYLVHSMLPSSRLFQGNFQDTDLFLADNFATACVKVGVKQIVYLGGLVPEKNISKHLSSRKEVEDVFQSSGIPVTILRAGMIVGNGGSSFEILKNLVLRLPAMLLPKWTASQTQTVYIDDLLAVIQRCLNNEHFYNKTINVVNGEKITYEDLIRQTSYYLAKKKLLIRVPINSSSFSKLWVSLFGQTDYELVSPLIDSLKTDLPCPETPEEIADLIHYRSYQEMLKKISKEKVLKKKKRFRLEKNTVRSIQRLENPLQLDEQKVSNAYIHWLPGHMFSLIQAVRKKNEVLFYLPLLKKPLLILDKVADHSALDRCKLHIVGGLLSKTKDTGWLEFRNVANGKYTLVSINEYVPSLPWYIYVYSQAIIHSKVMQAFGRYLKNIKLNS